jgi:hypothetical protein
MSYSNQGNMLIFILIMASSGIFFYFILATNVFGITDNLIKYILIGVLGTLLIFGPVIYLVQKARRRH